MSLVVATIFIIIIIIIIIEEGNKSRGGDITPNISRSYTRWCRVGLERLARQKSPILTAQTTYMVIKDSLHTSWYHIIVIIIITIIFIIEETMWRQE